MVIGSFNNVPEKLSIVDFLLVYCAGHRVVLIFCLVICLVELSESSGLARAMHSMSLCLGGYFDVLIYHVCFE